MVPGPILWGPLSEAHGRRIIIVVPFLLFVVTLAGQGLAQNMTTLIVTRFISGILACSPIVVGAGYVVDIWNSTDRGIVMSITTLGLCFGPVLGPLAGSL